MPNTNVFTGADGSISLAPGVGPEGTKASEVIEAYEMFTVGRVQDVKVTVQSDIKVFHEIGQRYGTEIRPGNIHISGTIGRAYINGALLKLLLGEAAASRPAGSWAQPTFNITLLLTSAAVPDVRNTLTLYDVKFSSWTYMMPEDDFLLEAVSFQALYLSVQDEP